MGYEFSEHVLYECAYTCIVHLLFIENDRRLRHRKTTNERRKRKQTKHKLNFKNIFLAFRYFTWYSVQILICTMFAPFGMNNQQEREREIKKNYEICIHPYTFTVDKLYTLN